MSSNIFNTSAASDYLNEEIPGESAAYWNQRLINARRTDRKSAFAIPFSTMGKAVFYDQSDLDEFVEFEKTRRLGKVKLSGRAAEVIRAFGIGESNGGSQGRKFKSANVYLQTSHSDGTAFVQTIFSDPLLVFALSPDQALELGKELLDTANAAKRINLGNTIEEVSHPNCDTNSQKSQKTEEDLK